MRGYIPVQGTWSWRDPRQPSAEPAWWQDGSPLARQLLLDGLQLASPTDPFIWDTGLAGVFWRRMDRWRVAGWNLAQWTRMKLALGEIHHGDMNFLVHSHGWQVVLFALYYGMRARNVVTVGSPLRQDVFNAVGAAVLDQLDLWSHITDSGFDKMRDGGTLGDGHLGVVKRHPRAQVILVDDISHSRLLTDWAVIPRWHTEEWAWLLERDHRRE